MIYADQFARGRLKTCSGRTDGTRRRFNVIGWTASDIALENARQPNWPTGKGKVRLHVWETLGLEAQSGGIRTCLNY